MKGESPILLGPRTRPALLKYCFQFKAQVIWDFHAIPHLYLEKKTSYVHRRPFHLEGKDEKQMGENARRSERDLADLHKEIVPYIVRKS